MASHYTLRTFIFLSVITSLSTAFGGPVLLAPEPILHDMMRDGFFAQELIKKRPALLKAGGAYPSLTVGGAVDMRLMKQLNLKSDIEIESISVNTGLCLSNYAMLVLPLKYEQKKKSISLERFAFILGDYSRYKTDTKLGGVILPFKLCGAIGQFISPAIPWRSKMIEGANDIELFAEDITNNEWRSVVEKRSGKSDVERSLTSRKKQIRETQGLLIGLQKDFGAHTVSMQVMPFPWDRLIVNPQVTFQLPQLNCPITIGGGYDSEYRNGSVYFSLTKSIFSLSGHRLFIPHTTVEKDKKGNTIETNKSATFDAGHVEVGCSFPLPILELPTTLLVGYGWPQKIISEKEGQNAVFGTLKISLTKYAQLRIGFQLKNPGKNSSESPVKPFVMRLYVNF